MSRKTIVPPYRRMDDEELLAATGDPAASGAGPRHAAGDPGSDIEDFGRGEDAAGDLPEEEADALANGLSITDPDGQMIAATPADAESPRETREAARPHGDMLRLIGFEAIEYAEKQGLLLNKHPDSINGPRAHLTVAEAEAIADEDENLIWLDVPEQDYFSGPPIGYEPSR